MDFYGMHNITSMKRRPHRGSEVCFGGSPSVSWSSAPYKAYPETTTTSTFSNYTPFQARYLTQAFKDAQQTFNEQKNKPYYSGQEVAEFNPDQLAAQANIRGILEEPPAYQNWTQGMLAQTVRGDYLDPESNPWLKKNVEHAVNTALPAMDANASKYGAYGSSDWAALRGQTAGDIATKMYGENYANERNRMLQAAGLVPTFANMARSDINALMQSGQVQQQQRQNELNAIKREWEWTDQQPWRNLEYLSKVIGGNWGGNTMGGSTTDYMYHPNQTPMMSGGGFGLGSILGGIGSILGAFF